jgi:hypothetical protein
MFTGRAPEISATVHARYELTTDLDPNHPTHSCPRRNHISTRPVGGEHKIVDHRAKGTVKLAQTKIKYFL